MIFILAILTTASIVQTFLTSFLFQTTRDRIAKLQNPGSAKWKNMLFFLPLCQYCLVHWVGFIVWMFAGLGWLYLFPIIWLSNHSIALFNLLLRADGSLHSITALNAEKIKAVSSGRV